MALRTVSYESVLRGIANLGGVKRNALLKETSSLLFEYINMAVRKAYEYDWWPELTTVEKRYWRDGLWSAGTYPDGSIVYHATTEKYWINSAGASTTDEPSDTVTNDWTDPGDFNRYVSFTQMTGTNLATAQTEIDAVKAMYQFDPRVNRKKAGSAFVITEDGVAPKSEDFDICWLEFKKRPDDMSGMVEWDEDDTYAVGEYVYYQGSSTPLAGEAYKVIVATTAGQDPQDTPASFQKFSIPYIMSTYLKYEALANWLAAGGGGASSGEGFNVNQVALYRKMAADALEDISFNLRARSGQYDHYVVRTS